MPSKENFNLFNKVADVMKKPEKKEEGMPAVPDEVITFLGKLSMLEGVPLHNLVPSPLFLPVEQVGRIEKGAFKFFYLDPEWVAALLNGALSLADEKTDLLLQQAMTGEYAAKVYFTETKDKILRQIAGLYAPAEFKTQMEKRMKEKNLDYNNPAPTTAQTNWRYTGFFIRSSIIQNWTDLEIIARGKYDLEEMKPRRIVKKVKVAKDTMFCICEGIITEIEINQPAETIHFDATNIKDIPFRKNVIADRVLDISTIIDKPKTYLGAKVTNSALLAKQLLANPVKSILTIERKETEYDPK